MGQKDKRYRTRLFLEFCCKAEYILVSCIIHAYDHVNVIICGNDAFSVGRGGSPDKAWGIAEIEVDIFPVNLGLDLTVFFEYECIVVAAYHQNLPDPEFDQ